MLALIKKNDIVPIGKRKSVHDECKMCVDLESISNKSEE